MLTILILLYIFFIGLSVHTASPGNDHQRLCTISGSPSSIYTLVKSTEQQSTIEIKDVDGSTERGYKKRADDNKSKLYKYLDLKNIYQNNALPKIEYGKKKTINLDSTLTKCTLHALKGNISEITFKNEGPFNLTIKSFLTRDLRKKILAWTYGSNHYFAGYQKNEEYLAIPSNAYIRLKAELPATITFLHLGGILADFIIKDPPSDLCIVLSGRHNKLDIGTHTIHKAEITGTGNHVIANPETTIEKENAKNFTLQYHDQA